MILAKGQQGIALIQVLLISAVLTVLALFLTSTARDQVKMAQWSDDKAAALVALHSTESELLFALLVDSKVKKPTDNFEQANEISNNWNFFAKPFIVNKKLANKTTNQQVTITIQDQTSLIHAHFPDSKLLKALIAYQGYSDKEINSIFDNLLDWQDLDSIPRINGDESLGALTNIRNGSIPDLHDFSFVKGINAELLGTLVANTTLYGRGFFNPMNATKALLAAITNTEIAEQIIMLRETKQLNNSQFSQLTGIVESEKVLFYPSNILAITLKGQVGTSSTIKNIIIELNPYAKEYQQPINTLSNRG